MSMRWHWHHTRAGHIMGGMIMMTTDAHVMSIDELKAFLASSAVFTFKGSSWEETHVRK